MTPFWDLNTSLRRSRTATLPTSLLIKQETSSSPSVPTRQPMVARMPHSFVDTARRPEQAGGIFVWLENMYHEHDQPSDQEQFSIDSVDDRSGGGSARRGTAVEAVDRAKTANRRRSCRQIGPPFTRNIHQMLAIAMDCLGKFTQVPRECQG